MFDYKRNDKWILLSLLATTICSSFILAGVASAGAVAGVRPTFSFTNLGRSSVLLTGNSTPNPYINQTMIANGTTFTARGWPDLNGGGTYRTLSAGVFDGNASDQSQLLTRQPSTGANPGLFRTVTLATSGIAPGSAPYQHFIGGFNSNWSLFGVGDVNDDGTDDIVLWYSATDANFGLIRVVFMSPSTPFAVLTTQDPGSLPTSSPFVLQNVPAGVADADGDGQADLWTIDVITSNAVEILISANTIASGGGFASTQVPTTVPSEYSTVGIGPFNQDIQSDILFEKTSGSNMGLLRVDHTGDNGGSVNAAATVYPILLDGNASGPSFAENVAALGDYDGMNGIDILTRMQNTTIAANEGAVTVRLMNAAGTATTSNGSPPWGSPPTYSVVRGAPQ